MNKSRRNQLRDIRQELRDIHERLTILRDEEEKAFDNMPESLQDSERGETAQNAIDTLESVVDQVLEAADEIDEILE